MKKVIVSEREKGRKNEKREKWAVKKTKRKIQKQREESQIDINRNINEKQTNEEMRPKKWTTKQRNQTK